MLKSFNLDVFKSEYASSFARYELEYKSFKEGDFGSLDQVVFNSNKKGGNIDFWGMDWLGIFVWDYESNEELLNILLDPSNEKEKVEAFRVLLDIIAR
ncbi:MAG: hypothetical protein JNL75_04725 [Chitinophagales bacterium]|nr:hypothetical protein [Chitinophagales bacterium]